MSMPAEPAVFQAPTLVDVCADRLAALCGAARFRGGDAAAVLGTFGVLTSPWGERPLGQPYGWVSEISDDNTPVEFSVAISEGRAEVRVLLEAQGEEPTLDAFRAAALALNRRLEDQFGADLTRFRAVADLFVPEDMQGPFALWHSAVFAPGRPPSFKAYLNAHARGPARAEALVKEALRRLDLPGSWDALTAGPLRRGAYLDEIKYLALDLDPRPEARVKVYVRHHGAAAEDLERAACGARDHAPGETRAFVRAMRGGDAPLRQRAAFTCHAFVAGGDDRAAAATIYVPVCAYARDDAAVRGRVVDYLHTSGLDPSLYQSICDSYANRPLHAGVGMQSWVARRRHSGSVRLTIYLGTEAMRVHAPGVVPAPTPDRSRPRAMAGSADSADGGGVKGSTLGAVLEFVDQKARELRAAPLFEFLRDTRISPKDRLAFAPHVSHFVMTFADLYTLVLREEPPADRFQELVNAHAREDAGHWRWFLADLEQLGEDPSLRLSETLRLVWSEATVKMRLLSYHMCRLGFGADSLRKLVLVHCIEATGAVTLEHVARVGHELATLTGKRLAYFGPHHFDTESGHTLEENDVRRALEAVPLEASVVEDLCALVNESFRHFTAFAEEMLALARSHSRTASG